MQTHAGVRLVLLRGVGRDGIGEYDACIPQATLTDERLTLTVGAHQWC